MTPSLYRYFDGQRLTLQSGSRLPAAQSLLQLAGRTELLAQLAAEPTAQQLLDAAELAYLAGYKQQASTEFELQGLAMASLLISLCISSTANCSLTFLSSDIDNVRSANLLA